MKVKIQIDNKSRIQQGLDPIQAVRMEVEFSLDELNDEERKWIARRYSDRDGLSLVDRGPKFLLIPGTEQKEVISAIRGIIAKEKERKPRGKAFPTKKRQD